MPFTFSHPAAVIPFKYLPQKWISSTGLIIGSITPDFEYFIRMRVYSIYSHTWLGIFWFDLPMAILLCFIFHLIVRNALIDNLPEIFLNKFFIYKKFDWIKYFKHDFIVVIVSCLIGITTHVIWDSFTHRSGAFVEMIPFLQQQIVMIKYTLPVYKILQYLSSIFGGLLVVYVTLKFPDCNIPDNKKANGLYWILVSIIIFILTGFRIIIGLRNNVIGNLIVTIIAGGLLGIIITPLLLKIKMEHKT